MNMVMFLRRDWLSNIHSVGVGTAEAVKVSRGAGAAEKGAEGGGAWRGTAANCGGTYLLDLYIDMQVVF